MRKCGLKQNSFHFIIQPYLCIQGPRRLGYGKGEVDGKDLFKSGIVCKDVLKKQNPDAIFPGWIEADYDDSDWTPPVVSTGQMNHNFMSDATW